MLRSCDLIAFVTTSDPTQARAFYEGVLGLDLVADEPFALVFDANGVMLRIAKVDEVSPTPHTVLGWRVDDIESTVSRLAGEGVVFERFEGLAQDELGIWDSPAGGRVAWFKDPDGNMLSLTRF